MTPPEKPGLSTGNIVIVGNGVAAWLTAIRLAKALGGKAGSIHIVAHGEEESYPISSSETLRLLHDDIGLDQSWIIGAARGGFKLGTAYSGWYQAEQSYFSPFGEYGAPMNGVPFWHFWLKAKQKGRSYPLSAFSLSTLAAQSGRFSYPGPDTNSLDSTLSYGLHLDGVIYKDVLKNYALSIGITHYEEQVETAKLTKEGAIDSLTLSDRQIVKGDLFVDASGVNRILIEGALKVRFISWADKLPCDRVMIYNAASDGLGEPYTSAVALPGGWAQRVPLNQQNGYILHYNRESMSDDEAANMLSKQGAVVYPGQLTARPYCPGRMESAWIQNCVAIGRAAGEIEDLGAMNMQNLQSSLDRLIEFLPTTEFADILAREYSAMVRDELDYMRDYVQFHYISSKRQDGEIWRAMKSRELPARAQALQEAFSARGVYREIEDDPVTQTQWVSAMLGYGIIPSVYHPMVDEMNEAELLARLDNMAQRFDEAAINLPLHQNFTLRALKEVKARMQKP